jgi:hypothetical protein
VFRLARRTVTESLSLDSMLTHQSHCRERRRNTLRPGLPRACNSVQGGHGNAGIHGIVGIVESVSYRIYRVPSGSNPTLSANHK